MKIEMTVQNFKRHVAELSARCEITVVYDESLTRHTAAAIRLQEESLRAIDRLAGLHSRVVHAPPIDDETSYVVVLHEFGHHLAPNGFCAMPKPKDGSHPRKWFEFYAAKLVCEEAAWDWARYFVEQVFEWTIAMEQTKQLAFASYERKRRTGR